MKLIIAGSRHITIDTFNWQCIESAINLFNINYNDIDEVVSGGAKGIDEGGELYAEIAGHDIKKFPANWEEYGNAAGPIRNEQMAEYADALLLIWDGESRGSANMKAKMLLLKKPVYEVILRKYNT